MFVALVAHALSRESINRIDRPLRASLFPQFSARVLTAAAFDPISP
jgi:hypothetical protein